jgi:hypothetical protein
MALTKTTALDVVDQWQRVLAGVLKVGSTEDVSGDYESLLYIEAVPIEAVEQDGMEITVEVSYADDNWTFLTKIVTSKIINDGDTLDGAHSAFDDILLLTAGAADILILGALWFIRQADPNIDESEVVRTELVNGVIVTIANGLINDHPDLTELWENAENWVVKLPRSASAVRVLYNNVDANCIMAVTTRISKVTALT